MPSGRNSCRIRFRWPGKPRKSKQYRFGHVRGAKGPKRYVTPTFIAPPLPFNFFQRVMAMFGMGNKFK